MKGPIPSFRSWSDRLAYVAAEGQLIVLGVMASVGAVIVLYRPSIPGIPPITWGILAALMLLGPPLLALFVTGARKLRNRNLVEVHEIDGARDVREKYYIPPETWAEKTVEGPPPKPCNDGSAWEVQELEYLEDIEELRVRGLWMAELQDSKLVSKKAMFEDMHNTLVEGYMDLVRLRGRIDRMGVEIQEKTMNEMAEAAERATMLDQDAVQEAYESARENVDVDDVEAEIKDVDEYIEEAPQPVSVEEHQPAATDGGEPQ